ncbi:DUF4349 domain-containing protein [Aquimarina algicola]|uniref:DUF4349 domain-containing protein n=1 Tax=Aquimarina algicola TaxID=2589995 RepID=A0A504JHQ1_9FLAO|nr:DUF4349 domain-containing protein [Aquimarina algicola]TPN87358.1 DUF4349 domain-containing protein [Aquimarina algicola]
MKPTFKKRFKKLILWLVALFIALFVFRFIYGYTKTPDNTSSQAQFFETISSPRKNYASKKYEVKSNTGAQSTIRVDQKYEKIAEIKTKSSTFEDEEKLARKTIEEFDALIQFEQKSGNKGYRRLNLVIGVPPENFDNLYQKLTQIGNIQAKQITKKDKTNEYKELNAKKQSLEKIRNSLIELKSKGGKIEEYMDLENRILEIEQQLQGLGVSLGDFDDENEFCTVQFSLLEGKEIKIGTMQRVKVALEWTIKMYLGIITILLFVTLFGYIFLLAVDKFKILEQIISRKE